MQKIDKKDDLIRIRENKKIIKNIVSAGFEPMIS